MLTLEEIRRRPASPVNIAAPYFSCALADHGIMGPGPFDAIKVSDIEVPGFDRPDIPDWFCRR
jgi:hypothetical protein